MLESSQWSERSEDPWLKKLNVSASRRDASRRGRERTALALAPPPGVHFLLSLFPGVSAARLPPATLWQPSGLRGAANRRRQDITGIEEPLRRGLREQLEHTRIYLAYMEGTKSQAPLGFRTGWDEILQPLSTGGIPQETRWRFGRRGSLRAALSAS